MLVLLLSGLILIFVIRRKTLLSFQWLLLPLLFQTLLLAYVLSSDFWSIAWIGTSFILAVWILSRELPRLWRQYHLVQTSQMRQRRG